MLAKIFSYISKFIPDSKLGVILSLLLTKASSVLIADIFNAENQRVAYYFVKALSENDKLTGKEKAARFNEQMLQWAKAEGKKISESCINCLRELAVNAFKAEQNA